MTVSDIFSNCPIEESPLKDNRESFQVVKGERNILGLYPRAIDFDNWDLNNQITSIQREKEGGKI